MHKQCLPGASPLFARAGDEANLDPYTRMCSRKYWTDEKKERGKKWDMTHEKQSNAEKRVRNKYTKAYV